MHLYNTKILYPMGKIRKTIAQNLLDLGLDWTEITGYEM
jgi:hypothetical protein